MTLSRTFAVTCLAATTVLFPIASSAHDFWLAPSTYRLTAPSEVPVSVLMGHPKDRLTWPVDPQRIVALRTVGPDGVRDQQSGLADYDQDEVLPIGLDAPGLHILTIETTNAFSELPATQFEDYLAEEGLTLIQLDRIHRGATDTPGTELYSRRGKALLQVGPVLPTDISRLRRPVGLTLEIIALDHPQTWVEGEILNVKVMFRGQPMSGITVGLVSTEPEIDTATHVRTDKDGTVSFAYPGSGTWMLHAVWSDRQRISDRADYNTIFSSLSFEVW